MAFLQNMIQESKSADLLLDLDEAALTSKEKEKLSSLENEYDRKYNWFCLSAAKYSDDKIENVKSKKEDELKALKNTKKSSKNRFDRLSTQVKIDAAKNIINKCDFILKKHNKK